MTHLDTENHSIFSLNSINNQPVDGLFLPSDSVMHIFLLENDSRVTEILFDFFMELFNFYGEYIPATKERSEKIPGIIFCKTKDEIDKINVLYNKSVPFQVISNAISDHLTEDDFKRTNE